MQRIYASDDTALVAHLEEVLRGRGVALLVKNRFLSGGAGQLPVNECWPEIWVMDDADAERARAIVDELTAHAHRGADWVCPECGETVEGQFGACWRCGTGAPETG